MWHPGTTYAQYSETRITLSATLYWRQVTEVIEGSIRNKTLPGHMGLFPFGCKMPGEEGNGTIGGFNLKYCEEWWLNLQTWEKIVSAAMVLAALIEAFALIWNLFTWCACCCKQFLLHPLTLASFCAAISLGTAVAFYGINNQSAFEGVLNWNDIKDKIETEVGYSFWLACGALVLAIADTIVAIFATCAGKACL
ncbi:hypothetical protein Aduo_019433 [Ancylostoma duodenale]